MNNFVHIGLSKGAKAVITSNESGFYVEVLGYGRILGKFQFDHNKKLTKRFIVEKDFYPLEVAIYELSKKRIYIKKVKKSKSRKK